MGEPGEMDQLSTGCFSGGIITSSASEGVKDGSASKIGVVSGEAIWLKSTTTKGLAETRSYRPHMQFPAVQRLASGRSVESSIPGVVEVFFPRDERASAELNPIPTIVPCQPPKCTRSGWPKSTSLLLTA